MITLITGLTGSGKTWFMTHKCLLPEWKTGSEIFGNFPLFFPNGNERVNRFHQLPEIYHLKNGVIAIDEAQKLFDARRWQSTPVSFTEMIAQHRKHLLDLYTTTQDIGHIDVRYRSLVHDLYRCESIFRFPPNERLKPIIQIIKVVHKKRKISSDTDRVVWEQIGRKFYFISKLWTQRLYDTYADVGLNKYICRMFKKDKKWRFRLYNRDLVNRGARI